MDRGRLVKPPGRLAPYDREALAQQYPSVLWTDKHWAALLRADEDVFDHLMENIRVGGTTRKISNRISPRKGV